MTPSRPAALIVEDQPFVGLVASDILRESGFETFHAYDAQDAAQLLEDHPEIEVVITDVQLHGAMDGLQLCRQLSSERPQVRLVLTSAGQELTGREVPRGASVLHKPYSSSELRALVAGKILMSA